MNYLSLEEILIFHDRIIDESGGSYGVRDSHLVRSIAERPKMQFGGEDLYPTVFDKAAVYFDSCSRHHAFIDGNKRTAIAITVRFLSLNGYNLKATDKKIEGFVLNSVRNKYKTDKISVWLSKNSKRIHGK